MLSTKLFSLVLMVSMISHSVFATDDMIAQEITMGKIEAAEQATLEAEDNARMALLEETQALLQMAMALQEEVALTQTNSTGMVSALGQLIFVLDKNAIKLSFGTLSAVEMADINATNLEAKELMELNK